MYSSRVGSSWRRSSGSSARGFASFIPLLLIVVVFYFLLIRPQQRKAKQHQELVQSIGPGDRVVTIGGIHGAVGSDGRATPGRIEIAPRNDRSRMTRGAIARRLVDARRGTASVAVSDATDTP